jgi:Phosphotransferase enzyme family
MVRNEVLCDGDVEALREHRAQRCHLHLAEARQGGEATPEIGAVRCFRPDALRAPAVLVHDDRCELLHALRHVPGEAVHGRLLAEDTIDLARIGAGDRVRVEGAQPLLDLQRPREGRLDGHLLVERESDQQRHWLLAEQGVGFLVPREVEHRPHDCDATPIEWEPIEGGYTRARKWRVRLDDGTHAFAKEAPATEVAVYESVRGSFLPRVYEIRDDVLLLEDLSDAHWPPPYPADTDALFAALEAVATTAPPPGLRRLQHVSSWEAIASEPQPLLALGLCSAGWLENALPALIDAEARVPLVGDGLVHYDVWAGNLCFLERGMVLVDWAEACIGNPRVDLAFALLSLRVESAVYPAVDDEPALAAFVTGAVAAEAVRPPPEWAQPGSTLREDQRNDLAVALPWVAQQLGRPLGERERR